MGRDTAPWLFGPTGLLESYFRCLGFWHLPAFVSHISECPVCSQAFLQLNIINLLHLALLSFLVHPLQLHGWRNKFPFPSCRLFRPVLPLLLNLNNEKFSFWQDHPEPAGKKMLQSLPSMWHSALPSPCLWVTSTAALSTCLGVIHVCDACAHLSRELFPWNKPVTWHTLPSHFVQQQTKQIVREWVNDMTEDEH